MGKVKVMMLLVSVIFLQGCAFLFAPSENKLYKKALKNEPYDAIIVPGLPFEGDKWSDYMKLRVYWAYHLCSTGKAKNVIFSGSAVYTPYVEAKIMSMYGRELGINPENIFIETRAEHSTENLYYSYQIAKEQGFKKVALATDPWQTRFLYFFAKKKHIPVAFIPAQIDTVIDMFTVDPAIDYEKAYVQDFVALPDRESFFERLKGTRGKKIVYQEDAQQRRKEEAYLMEENDNKNNSR